MRFPAQAEERPGAGARKRNPGDRDLLRHVPADQRAAFEDFAAGSQIPLTHSLGSVCSAPLLFGDNNTMAKLSVRDLNAREKRVFLRVDYNVPLEEKDGRTVITDETRMVETLPTLKLLLEQGAKLILAAHLGLLEPDHAEA